MTKKDITTLHDIHPWHERYIKLTDDLSPLDALEKHRSLFTTGDIIQMDLVGDQTYAPGKWTIRDILQHLVDTERILSCRALCIARNEQADLPNYDEAAYAPYTNASNRTITDLLEEFELLRRATIILFRNFNQDNFKRVGTTAGKNISVLALAYVLAGHPLHHLRLIRSHYLPLLQKQLRIVKNEPGYLRHFEGLNKAWITKLEPEDIRVLEQAQETIIDQGGVILYALDQQEVVGTVALQPQHGEWEMIKMAVAENQRQQGIGQFLIQAAIREAGKMGIDRLTLHSNSSSNAKAVGLYRKMGFEEVPMGRVPYERANIKMEIKL